MRHVALFAMCVGVLALGFALPVHAQGRVVDRYEIKPPTQDQLRKAREWMIALGKQAQQAAPKLHRGETAYFYLFSAFENKADDKRYSDTAEKMFKELCTQFKVNPKSVWIGKCPIFAFNDAKQYATFCAGLGFTGDIEKSGGLTLFRSDGLVCIALNDTKTQTQFYDTMVHEGTHAFMARFLTTRFLPVWVNEGIAEHMCARIIEDSRAKTLWQEATKQVIDGERKPETIFDGVNLDAFDYGMAHALVRFMIEKDGTAFSQFIRRLKQGESEEAALKAAYKTDRAGLIRNWRAGAEESLKAAQREAEKKEALKETQKPDPQAKAAPSDKTEAKTTPPPKEPLKPIPPHPSPSSDDPLAIMPATEEQAQAAKEWAMDLGDRGKQAAPKMHLVETSNFYLYSTFENKAGDTLFRDTADRMFKELCKQFQVNPDEVWLDKCPILSFNDTKQFVAFCKTIDIDEERAEKTGGFAWWRSDGLVYIVLHNKWKNTAQFYDTMVHEGTHAFMARYLTSRPLPTWVNEGFAEHMCATLLKDSRAKTLWQDATKQVLAGKENPRSIFADTWRIESFDYGMAHSLVRFMIRKDNKAFVEFIRLLKQGKSEEDALQATYKTDREGLLKAWRTVAAQTIK